MVVQFARLRLGFRQGVDVDRAGLKAATDEQFNRLVAKVAAPTGVDYNILRHGPAPFGRLKTAALGARIGALALYFAAQLLVSFPDSC